MPANLRPSRRLLTCVPLVAVVLCLPLGASAGQVPPCSSFKSQAAALRYFFAVGGAPKRPVGQLDPDHDGVACEELPGPYEGFATLAYNEGNRSLHGTATMPSNPYGYSCMIGNTHYAEAARILNVYRVKSGGEGEPIIEGLGIFTEPRPASGRLVWRIAKKNLAAGRYYAEYEEQVRKTAYAGTECPSFRSRSLQLP